MKPEIQYDNFGRMRFHPEFHAKHKKPWTNKEEQYLIEHYVNEGPEAIAMALERTIATIHGRACALRKAGKMPARPKGASNHKKARRL